MKNFYKIYFLMMLTFVFSVQNVSAQLEGTWKMAPEAGSLGVGPAQGDISWWSIDAAGVETRACFFDDEYIFGDDGSFSNVLGDDTWVEAWQGVEADGCGAPVAPHDGTVASTFTYDSGAGTLVLNGLGAYLGIPKAVNGSELASPADAPESITYMVSLENDGDIMVIDISSGDAWWRFKLVKDTFTPPPPTGSLTGKWKMAPEAGSLGVGPGQGDISWWAIDAAGVETRACFFDDEYIFGEDGSFSNVLGDETWVEAWQGVEADACGAPVAPHDGTVAATYTYDEGAGTVSISGMGAYLGIPKAVNGSELASPADAPESITYMVSFENDGDMVVIDINSGDAWWRFKLIKDTFTPPPTGSLVGKWQMAPEAGSFGVGPGQGDISWWAIDDAGVTDRACFFDDEYIFGEDGSFSNVLGEETWVEAWQGVEAEGCSAPVAPHDGTVAATYIYDEGAGTVTINGMGAYLGIPKAVNGSELASPADAPESVTYIVSFENDGAMMVLDIGSGDAWWRYKLAYAGGASAVSDLQKESVSVYPNPAQNYISLKEEFKSVQIYNVSGSMIMSIQENQSQIDVSGLASGVYFIMMKALNGEVMQSKFIKE